MATEYEQEQSDRDQGLIRRMCLVQEGQANYIQDWMKEELEALRYRAQMLQVMPLGERAKGELAACWTSLARVLTSEMPEAFTRLKERRSEIESILYEDPLDAEQHLNDGIRAILDLMRSVKGLRLEIDRLWSENTAQPEES